MGWDIWWPTQSDTDPPDPATHINIIPPRIEGASDGRLLCSKVAQR